MPRNSSGTYTLPVAAFVPGGLIKAADNNSNFSDIAAAITQSLATTGVSSMTGPLKSAAGSAPAPGITFGAAVATGFYLAGANQIGWSAGGAQAATFNADKSVSWVGSQSIGGTLAVVGAVTLASASITGAATVGGTLDVTGASTFAGKASFTSTDSMALPNGTTGQRNGTPTAGDLRYNSTLGGTEYWNGTAWVTLGLTPTVTRLTGGASSYVPPTGCIRLRVRMCGGGGAGGSAGGGTGSTTTFGGWSAVGGGGGGGGGTSISQPPGGAGGAGGTTGTGTTVVRTVGGRGQSGFTQTGINVTFNYASCGGVNPFGGASADTNSAAANTGGGGGANESRSGTNQEYSAGGGAGEYVEFYWPAPSASISYAVGGGSGNGGSGVIIIEEFYS